MTPDDRETLEWGDAVAAVICHLGAPSADDVSRLVASGDALLLALRDREEQWREMRAEVKSARERHACHIQTAARLHTLETLLREWQTARKPVPLSSPGVGVAESYWAAVNRMAAADEALATFDLGAAKDDEVETCEICRRPITGRAVRSWDDVPLCEKCAELDRNINDALNASLAATAEIRKRERPVVGGGDCHIGDSQRRRAASLREELTEIIRWRFCAGDGEIMDGAKMLAEAQRIANEIAPYIEEAVLGHHKGRIFDLFGKVAEECAGAHPMTLPTRAQLARIEWASDALCEADPCCPACNQTEDDGHAPDCWLAAALAPEPAPMPALAVGDIVTTLNDDDPEDLGCRYYVASASVARALQKLENIESVHRPVWQRQTGEPT